MKTNNAFYGFAVCILSLLVWRLLRFSVIPRLYPDDPKPYPYWVPVIGHLRAFIANSHGFITRARLYFGDTREPFEITIANKTVYIITKPEHAALVYRNSSTLTSEIFARTILRDVGCSESALNKIYAAGSPENEVFPNPQRLHLGKLTYQFHLIQLSPGCKLDQIGTVYVQYFNKNLEIESLLGRSSSAEESGDTVLVSSIYSLVSNLIVGAAQEAYFGQLMHAIEPNLTQKFLDFDDRGWQLLFQYPAFLSSRMRSAMNQVINAMEKYFSAPMANRADAVWFTPTLEREFRQLMIGNKDIAAMMMAIFWGINTTPIKSTFWMISYIIFHPELIETLREETKPAFSKDGHIDVIYIINKCPRLRAIWDEVLRVTGFATSVRYAHEDVTIGSKTLRKGSRIMIPTKQLHLNEDTFGSRPGTFDSERFLRNPKLRRHDGYRPFGGGATLCPGRNLATMISAVFVAILLHRFDICLEPSDQAFPRSREAIPVMGIVDLEKTKNLSVRLTSRR